MYVPDLARSICRDDVWANLLEGGLGLMPADHPELEPGVVPAADMSGSLLSKPVIVPDPAPRQPAAVVGRLPGVAAVLKYSDEPPGPDNPAPASAKY